MKNLRQKVLQQQTLIGSFLNLGSPLTAEIVGAAGFDFVVIDLEHGAGTEADVLPQLQALESTPAAAVVRVESHERQRAHRVLDWGAHGIMFPRVNSASEARACVAALRYPPAGVRGLAAMNRACGFGTRFQEYVQTSAETILGIVQIETVDALHNLDEIAAVDGVDVLFVGPLDLSGSLGILRDFHHPLFRDAVERVARAAARHSKMAGILLPAAADFSDYYRLGYRFLACGSDGAMIAATARQLATQLSELRNHCHASSGKAPESHQTA